MQQVVTNNTAGLASIGYNVKLKYYPAFDYNALLQAAIDGCKVINCSWVTSMSSVYSNGFDATQQQIINQITALGTTVVAAAGNNNTGTATDYFFPASYDNVISVTSVGHQNEVGDYNNPCNWKDCHKNRQVSWATGCALYYQHNDRVDICAPGYYMEIYGAGNGYKLDAGTSLSSPLVAGTAALLYSLNPNFTPQQITNFIKNNAVNIYGVSDNYLFNGQLGAGKLNAGAALAAAANSACQNTFTDIVWERQTRSGSYTTLSNNYEAFTYLNNSSNNNIRFSLPSGVTPSANVDWEVYLNNQKVEFLNAGTSIIINLANWGLYPTSIQNQPHLNYDGYHPLACLNTLEIFVRQGSGCCYSAYYREDAVDPSCTYVKANNVPTSDVLQAIEAKKNLFSVYPSPANQFINIFVDAKLLINRNITYQIFSIDGKMIKNGTLNNANSRISISDFGKGVYYIKTNVGSSKFVKE